MGKKDFCCAPGCSHQRDRGATCSMHRIPKEPQWLRLSWLNKIKRDEIINGKRVPWTPKDHTRLCSCHFDNPPNARNKFAIPTKFAHTCPKPIRSTTKSTNRQNLVPRPRKRKLFKEIGNAIAQDTDLQEENISEPVKKIKCDASSNTSPEKPAVLKCHDYIRTTVDLSSYEFVQEYPDLADMCKKYEEYKVKAETLDKLNATSQILTLNNIKDNPKLMKYYTGLPEYSVFDALFTYLKPKAEFMKYLYGERTLKHIHFEAKGMSRKPGRPRATTLEEEFFMVLVRLRLGLPSADTAIRFGIAESTFSSLFTSWVNLLSIELEKINKMPPTGDCDSNIEAECFSEFSNVKIVIDCTELFSETPSSLSAHKQFHSNYKHHSTVKFLVGMNTGGAITYISRMFGGRASDKFITKESLDLTRELLPGEKVMADRGFTIEEDLPPGVKLVIPGFKHRDKSQFSKAEIQHNKKISEARVHIERAIRRIKQFLVLKNEVKLSQVQVYENMFKACGYLVNFQDPFLKCTA